MKRGEVYKVKSSDFTLDLTHGKQVISTQKGQNKSQCEDSTRKEDTQAQTGIQARAPAARCPQMKRHTAHSSA
jgi:hypothetical protein